MRSLNTKNLGLVGQLLTFKPFNQKRPTVPLNKTLEPIGHVVSAKETGSILKIGFAYSKWPHLHRAYQVSNPFSSSETVHLKIW